MSWTPVTSTSTAWQYATTTNLGLQAYDFGTYDGSLNLYDYLIGGAVTIPWNDRTNPGAGWTSV